MDDPIISRDTIRARARKAFAQGRGRDAHHMNPGAPAVADWLDEYDRCAREALEQLLAEDKSV